MNSSGRDAALRTLEVTPRVLASLIDGAPPHLLAPSEAGAWNAATVVAHLVMTGRRGAINRIREIVAADNPALMNRDEEEELARSGLRTQSIEAVLSTFVREREADISWLRACDDGVWARPGTHSVAGVVTAAEFLQHAAYHDLLHVGQITEILQGYFEPLRGPMRQF